MKLFSIRNGAAFIWSNNSDTALDTANELFGISHSPLTVEEISANSPAYITRIISSYSGKGSVEWTLEEPFHQSYERITVQKLAEEFGM